MPRSTIAAISRAAHSSALQQLGFRRRGVHLARQSADLFHGIHFQASKWGTRSEGQFTIDLVVTAAFIYEAWTGKPLPANPATALFPVQQRLGFLLPQRRDHWWPFTDSPPDDALLAEVTEALTTYGVPFLDQFPSSRTLLQRLRAGEEVPGLLPGQPAVVRAILEHYHGEGAEAQRLLEEARARAGSSPFRATVEAVADRLLDRASTRPDT